MGNKSDSGNTGDREIVISRSYRAPRELVFRAWTDPEQIGLWWGPTGFTITTHSREVRPGGLWEFTMHGPDGVDYPNRVHWLEVVPPERLRYQHVGEHDLEEVLFETLVTFEEEADGTRLTMLAVLPTAEERERVIREHNAIEGGKQTLARLAEHLASL